MEKKSKTDIGFFSEMGVSFADCGSISKYIVNSVDYDKSKIIQYLESFKHKASCPRAAIDCLTKEKINDSFLIYEDDSYRWADFFIYHIKKYNIKLPDEFVQHVLSKENGD
jgi:hypothetical protein